MADTSVSFKCPNCGGPLAYKPGQGEKIKCEYCETEFEVETLEKLYAQSREEAAAAEKAQESQWKPEDAGSDWQEEDITGMRTLSCPSCGAEIVCDENTMATQCCYCGNPTLVPGKFSGGLKPDYIIPFVKTKEDAIAQMKKFYKGKWLLPSNYASASRLEKVQGMYVPFWLFDASVEGHAQFSASNSRSWDDGDETITETDHYTCVRQGTMDFHRVPVDGSKSMDDGYMQSIEPYDYQGMKEFTTTYMAGYLADKYDVTAQDACPIADKRISYTAGEQLKETVTGFDSVSVGSCHIVKNKSNTSYAMAPVWILSSQYEGKTYTFMMNGQTGTMAGSLPVDEKKGKLFGALAGLITLPLTYYISKCIWYVLTNWQGG